MKKCKTLDDIKQALNKVFKHDITITWDAGFKMYKVEPTNEAGEVAIHNYFRNSPFKKTKLLTESNLDRFLNWAGKLGLCYQIESPEEDEDTE